MNRTHTAVFLALALIVVAVPAATAGGTSSRSDTVTAFFPTPTVSSADRYQIDLSADTSVEATLSWDDEQTDLDLFFAAPGGTCNLVPPEVGCLTASAEDRVRRMACQKEQPGQTVGLGPGTETISTTADGHDSGEATYGLWVLVSTGVPLLNVDYHLTLTTGDDGHEDLNDGPDPFTLIRSDGHCRGL